MWKSSAKSLRIGTTRKIICCGTDASAMINNSEKGLSLYCFRCGRKEWEPHGPRSLHEIMATRRATDAIERTATMPADAVALTAGPSAAHLWVLAGGLAPELANDEYGFRWHEPSRRVLIPLDGGLLGRAVYGERPKYRLFGAGRSYWLREGPPEAVVVVEDVLSAIAVNRAGWRSVAVLGTSISSMQASGIDSPHVIGWFDSDKAGGRAWVRLRQAMALYTSQLHRVQTDKDPKCLHRADIINQLESAHADV